MTTGLRRMGMYKLIIFDLDGTLLDSSQGIINAFIRALEEYGLPPLTPEDIRPYIGPPVQNCARDHFGLTEEQTDDFDRVFRRIYYGEHLFEAVPYPDADEVLGLLEKEHTLAVATNKETSNSARVLKHFGLDGHFSSIKGYNNVKGYMKADMIRELLTEFSVQKEDAVLIGDSMHDAGSAESAGVDFMPLTSGFGFRSIGDLNGVRYKKALSCLSDLLRLPRL